jgi:hypothetical protein
MAPLKNLTNFNFCFFFSRRGGIATLGVTLALELGSTNIQLYVLSIWVFILCIPLKFNLSSNITIPRFEFHEYGFVVCIACFFTKNKASWQIQRNFQDTLVAKFLKAKLIIGDDGQMHHVGVRSAHKLSARISIWCPSWMGSINTLGEIIVNNPILD